MARTPEGAAAIVTRMTEAVPGGAVSPDFRPTVTPGNRGWATDVGPGLEHVDRVPGT